MKYLLMIYDEEANRIPKDAPEFPEMMSGYVKLNQELEAAGRHLGGEPLEPIATATTVRIRNDETLITDGPFAETKEQLGGFYLIEADDLDEALGWAAKIPTARTGCVEVRPVADLS